MKASAETVLHGKSLLVVHAAGMKALPGLTAQDYGVSLVPCCYRRKQILDQLFTGESFRLHFPKESSRTDILLDVTFFSERPFQTGWAATLRLQRGWDSAPRRQLPLPFCTERSALWMNPAEGLRLAGCSLIFEHNGADLGFQSHYERFVSEQLKRGKGVRFFCPPHQAEISQCQPQSVLNCSHHPPERSDLGT